MIYQKAAFRFVNVNLPRILTLFLPGAALLCCNLASADSVKIVDVTTSCQNQTCTFNVTLQHADTGWEHYADFWRVVSSDGEELGKRVLLHPHVNEQPFTRSLSGIEIPPSMNTVWVEANDSVHGLSSDRFKVDL